MSPWLDNLTGWLSAHPQWLGLAIFLIACGECLAIVGLLVPGTVLLFAVAVLAGHGALPLGQTLLWAYCGGVLGDCLSYALGRHFHQDIRRLPLLRHRPYWLDNAQGYLQRYGIASLLLGRFIGPLRPMLPMIAGMFDMPFPRFFAVSLLASLGWALAYLLPGWSTGAALRLALPPGFWPQAGVLAAALSMGLALSIHCSLRDQRQSSLLTGACCLLLLAGLILGWPQLSALDQGLLAVLQEQRSPSRDAWVGSITRLGDGRVHLLAAALLCLGLLAARQWRASVFVGLSLLTTALSNAVLKALLARPRPSLPGQTLESFSFPSGHSSAAFALCLALAILAGRGQPPRMRLTWLFLACLPALAVAGSRVYLGAHWPSDTLGGALLAAACCALSLSWVERNRALPALSTTLWGCLLAGVLALFGVNAAWQWSAGFGL